jgi:hypothetical protein
LALLNHFAGWQRSVKGQFPPIELTVSTANLIPRRRQAVVATSVREEKESQRMKRSLVRIVAAAAVLLGPVAVDVGTASPAQAASCYGYTCHGLDPIKAGCPVSSTVTTYGALATVWNRYSDTCKANWGRAQLTPAAAAAGYQWIVVIDAIDSHGYSERMCYPWNDNTGYLAEQCVGTLHIGSVGYDGVAWTDMLDGTKVTHASIVVYDPNAWPYQLVAQYSASQ